MTSQLDHLDQIARRVAKDGRLGPQSTGENVYIALAANRPDCLDELGYTIAEAIARIGPEWTDELVKRWQYQGDPTKAP